MRFYLLAILFLSGSAFAACNQNMDQMDLNICSYQEYKTVDKKLNYVYNNYLKKIDEERKLKFKVVQINWIKYKNSDCEYDASAYKGGSIESFVLNTCLINKTKLRIKELETYLKDENL